MLPHRTICTAPNPAFLRLAAEDFSARLLKFYLPFVFALGFVVVLVWNAGVLFALFHAIVKPLDIVLYLASISSATSPMCSILLSKSLFLSLGSTDIKLLG